MRICASLSAWPQMFAEEIAPAQVKTGVFRSSLQYKLLHGAGTEVTAPHPEVSVAVPVCILGRTQLCPEQGGASLSVLVNGNPILQESPTSIDDLCPGFHLQRPSATTREFMRHELCVVRLHPSKLSSNLHALLAARKREKAPMATPCSRILWGGHARNMLFRTLTSEPSWPCPQN